MTVPKTLIDGYNLLFQSPLVGKARGRDWLSTARQRLVSLLLQRLTPDELKTTHIVFDAPRVGRAPESEIHASGLSVVYAVNHAEADDLLEEIIRQHPTPKHLAVVSSDIRIRRCARSRRAFSVGAEQFLEQLERRPTMATDDSVPIAPLKIASDEPELLSENEIAFWLKEFGE